MCCVCVFKYVIHAHFKCLKGLQRYIVKMFLQSLPLSHPGPNLGGNWCYQFLVYISRDIWCIYNMTIFIFFCCQYEGRVFESTVLMIFAYQLSHLKVMCTLCNKRQAQDRYKNWLECQLIFLRDKTENGEVICWKCSNTCNYFFLRITVRNLYLSILWKV